jgi:hypothetical protein
MLTLDGIKPVYNVDVRLFGHIVNFIVMIPTRSSDGQILRWPGNAGNCARASGATLPLSATSRAGRDTAGAVYVGVDNIRNKLPGMPTLHQRGKQKRARTGYRRGKSLRRNLLWSFLQFLCIMFIMLVQLFRSVG